LLGGVLAIERRAADAMGRSPKQMDDEERIRFEAELERHEGDAARHRSLPVGTTSGDGSTTGDGARMAGTGGGDDPVRVHRKD
jgi:hypothetical protein